MKHPFNTDYSPPFPVISIALRNSDEGLRTEPMNALLDTGSDGSLVPIGLLQRVLAPPLMETHIRSHWGERRAAQLFLVDLEFDGLRLPGVFVVGDERGDEIVLGRNVLNKLRLLLDGPSRYTDVLSR
jgi:predicted aspartyl protease